MHISCPKLFDIEIHVNRKTKRALTRYLGGIVLYSGKKNCSAIAKSANIKHDAVYEFFECHVDEQVILQSFLNKLVYDLSRRRGSGM